MQESALIPSQPWPVSDVAYLAAPELMLGRYRVMDSRSTGGFGTVLTCWDTRLQRRVAIKRMPLAVPGAPASAASTVAEALTEARTACLLAHPNIVTVYDFETDAEWAYLVMEYVDGLNLAELLARVEGGTLTGDECAYVVNCVADALAFAHENYVLHLDIKPSNIIIDHSGAVKLCDFGMATLASATGFGDARGGTVGYMSPEQIRGQLVDERSDVFSLGVVVWQALTGTNPFSSTSAEQSLKLIEKGPRISLTKLVPELKGISEQALLDALSPNASMRTPSVTEFANELTFTMGDISAGAASLRHLLSQAGVPDDEDDAWEGDGLPLYFRYPWIEPLITRGSAALTAGYAALAALAPLFTTASATRIGAAAFAGITMAWPPLGGALVIVATLLALLTTSSGAAAILLPLILGCALIAWWVFIGTNDHRTTPAVLLPCCLANPIAGVAWAGAFLTPLAALATGAAGWLLGQTFIASQATGFSAADVANTLVELAKTPYAWIAWGGCALSALCAASITRLRPTTGCAVTGQIVGCIVLVASQLLADRMENGGIWLAPTWDTTGIAVVLCVLVSIVAALCGPALDVKEVEADELD